MKPVIDSMNDEITFRSEKNEYDVVMRKSAEKRQTLVLALLVIAVVTLIVWTMNSIPSTSVKNSKAESEATQAGVVSPSQYSVRVS